MPEFEETQPRKDPSHHYTPSENSESNKPRTRRRSGGFKKTPATGTTPLKIGEVDPSEVLKEDKPKAAPRQEPQAVRDEAEEAPRRERRAPRERNYDEDDSTGYERARPESASTGNPQPSSETLAAIKRVEARMAESRKERDAERRTRGDRPAERRSAPREEKTPAAARPRAAERTKAKPGLIGAIGSFVGKLFGGGKAEEAPAPKPAANREGNRGPRSGQQGRGGDRSGGRRRSGGGGGRPSGNRGGGQGRSRPRRDSAPRD